MIIFATHLCQGIFNIQTLLHLDVLFLAISLGRVQHNFRVLIFDVIQMSNKSLLHETGRNK